jgi:ribonuclease E
MQQEAHKRAVERALTEELKKDRARTKTLKTSKFGIIELTRQRIKHSIRDVLHESCHECKGSGLTKTLESLSLKIMRNIRSVLDDKELKTIEIVADSEVVQFLQNQKRRDVSELEDHYNKRIIIKSNVGNGWRSSDIKMSYYGSDGKQMTL